jgi:hypothetical protein
MKQFTIVGLTLALCGAAVCASAADFARPRFGFVAHTPDDWKVFGERAEPDRMLLDFGLPEVWSDVEKQNIENSVYIQAHRDVDSLEALISADNERVADMVVSREVAPAKEGKAFIVVSKIDGLEYKTLMTYRFENGIGYVIAFTATRGTFDKNLPKYRTFLEKFEFLKPAANEG